MLNINICKILHNLGVKNIFDDIKDITIDSYFYASVLPINFPENA